MEEHTKMCPEVIYRGVNLESDKIDTIIFSGGGVYGVLYPSLIKFLEDTGIYNDIKTVVGVSVGSIMALFIALGYSYSDIYKMVFEEIDLAKVLEINADNILNILDSLGINKGEYVEETIKNIISRRGLSPYITFKDLAESKIGPVLNIGFTRNFNNDFVMANPDTHPDMPVWLAIRASISIPLILTPVFDYESRDILYDGGVLNNTPIKSYLANWWSKLPVKPILGPLKHDVGTQTEENPQQSESKPIIHHVEKQPKKYRQHFWCIEIRNIPGDVINSNIDLKDVSLETYINWFIYKIFANQDSYRSKYSQYIQQFNTNEFPKINRQKFDLDKSGCELIIDKTYEKYKQYYREYLLG